MTQQELYNANRHQTSHTGNVGAGTSVPAGNVGAGSSAHPSPPAPEPAPAPKPDPSGDGTD